MDTGDVGMSGPIAKNTDMSDAGMNGQEAMRDAAVEAGRPKRWGKTKKSQSLAGGRKREYMKDHGDGGTD